MRKEIVIPMKLWLIELASILFLIVGSIAGTFLITRYRTINEIGTVNREFFTIKEKEFDVTGFENKYKVFLKDDEKAQYIIEVCKGFGLDPDIAIAILAVENPTANENAINRKNLNKTIDIGLFQLNDRSLYERGGFLDQWWTFDSKDNFDPFNWKHNAYIAIQYMNLLKNTFGEKNPYWIAAGYNAGITRAQASYFDSQGKKNTDDKLPVSTRDYYAPSVENNYNQLKMMENY